MRTLLRILTQLALGLWLGALVFFGFGVAAVAFRVLPPFFPTPADGVHAAGLVVAASLGRLHGFGFACGAVALVSILLARLRSAAHSATPDSAPSSRAKWPALAIVIMLLLTAASQFVVIPRMEAARAQIPGGEITSVPPGNPARHAFDRLHVLSTRLEGFVLLIGLGAFALVAAGEHSTAEAAPDLRHRK